MLALFRLIDITAGRVLLDGIDVAKIGLDALRRQLAIIPQVEMVCPTAMWACVIPNMVYEADFR